MNTPVFDITREDISNIEWLECRLFIEMSPDYFYYTVIDNNNSVVALKYYQISYNNNQEMVNLLEETVNEDPLLSTELKSTLIIFNWPENSLVPGKFFDKDINREMLGILHGYMNKGLILSEKIQGGDIYAVYRLPPVLDDFFQRRFPACTYRHYYSIWLDFKLMDEALLKDHVSIVFNPKEIIAAVFINKQVQIVQNLQYKTAEDIAWQLLNIYMQFNLRQEEVPLLVGGMIDQNSAMYEELLKYFQFVETDTMPGGLTVPEQFQSFPEHFFSPILKLALCAS